MCCRKNAFTVYHKLGIFLHCVPVVLCNELYTVVAGYVFQTTAEPTLWLQVQNQLDCGMAQERVIFLGHMCFI